MAMKACIIKFGFEDYLRIKRVSDDKSVLEFSRKDSQGHDPTMHHFPLKELLIPPLEFVEAEVKKLDLIAELEMRTAVSEMMELVLVLKDFVSYVNSKRSTEPDLDPKEEIWKFSLGIATFPKYRPITLQLINVRYPRNKGFSMLPLDSISGFEVNNIASLVIVHVQSAMHENGLI